MLHGVEYTSATPIQPSGYKSLVMETNDAAALNRPAHVTKIRNAWEIICLNVSLDTYKYQV